MSSRPKSFTAMATAASTSFLRDTSHRAKATPSDCAVRRPTSSFTSVMRTFAPSRANASAHAAPIPCAAPVTRATFPESLTLLGRAGGNGRHGREIERLFGLGHRRDVLAHRVLALGAALRGARAD